MRLCVQDVYWSVRRRDAAKSIPPFLKDNAF
jgi:hypothetical protein